MAKPVIFDDGGSIRIRELQNNTSMDGLIGVSDAAGNITFTGISSQQFFGGKSSNQCLLLVRSVAENGAFTQVPKNDGPSVTYGYPLHSTDTVVITTTDAQTVSISFANPAAPGFLAITLTTGASAVPRKKRRFYMIPVDMINDVTVTSTVAGVAPNDIFNAGGTSTAFTLVHFLDNQPTPFEIHHAQKLRKNSANS
jgi:hypothetical protein